jgi:hypothetical protein
MMHNVAHSVTSSLETTWQRGLFGALLDEQRACAQAGAVGRPLVLSNNFTLLELNDVCHTFTRLSARKFSSAERIAWRHTLFINT